MNGYDDEYTGSGRNTRQRPIEFDDSEFGLHQRGRRESDWADDLATRADGRLRHPDDDYAPRRPQRQPRQRDMEYYDNRDHYDNNDPVKNRPEGFRKRHPVLMNLLYIILTGSLLIWMLLWFLDFWTFHGEERVVPDVKGQTYESAAGNVDISGLNAIISDSVFDSYSRPGTVVEQTPIPGARIKKGGNVYLTVVAFSPKLITVPDFYNVSARQSRSMLEGIGI